MLSIVAIVNASKGWYQSGQAVQRRAARQSSTPSKD